MRINLSRFIALLVFLFLATTSGTQITGRTLDHKAPSRIEERLPDASFHGVYKISDNRYIIVASCDKHLSGQESALLCFLDPPTGRIGVLQPTSDNTFTFGANKSAGGEVVFLKKPDGSIEGLRWRDGTNPQVLAKAINSVSFEEVTFSNRDVKLVGRLTKPRTSGPHPALVMIHGSGNGGRDFAYYSLLATHLATQGVAVLTYDKRGFGASGGSGQNSSLQNLADDAGAAVRYLKQRQDVIADRIGLYGHSQGGFIAPLVSARGTEVAFMCLLAAPAVNTWDQELNEAESDMRGRSFSEEEVAEALKAMRLMFQVVSSGRGMLELHAAVQSARSSRWWGVVELSSSKKDLEQWRLSAYDPRRALEKLKMPVLALFGERDLIVPPRQNVPIWERYLRVAGNKDFTPRLVPAADHGLFLVRGETVGHGVSNESSAGALQLAPGVLDEITSWISRQAGLKVAQSNSDLTTLQQTITSASTGTEIDREKLIGAYAVGLSETVTVFKFGEFLMMEDFTTGRKAGLLPVPERPNVFNLVAHGPTPTPVQVTFEQSSEGTRIILREPAQPERRGQRINLRQEEVEFANGDTRLAGTLITPSTPGPHPAIIFVHGAGPATRLGFVSWAMMFARHGIAALAYDKRGTGKSTGDFRTSTYADLADDVLAGVQQLKRRGNIRGKGIGLLGTSQGPWIIGLAATRETDLAFLISSSGGPVSVAKQETYRRLGLVRDAGHSAEEVKLAELVLNEYFEYLRSGGKDRIAAVKGLWPTYKDEPWFKLLNLPATDPTVGEWPPARRTFAAELSFDSAAHYRQLRLPILALFGAADKLMPTQEIIAAFKTTLPNNGVGQLTVEVFPGADHGFMLPPVSGDIAHVAPGYFDKMIEWVKRQVKVGGVGPIK